MTKSDSYILERLAQGTLWVQAERGVVFSPKGLLKGKLQDGHVVHQFWCKGYKVKAYAHRIIWLATNGPIPASLVVDHKNRVRSDNRLSNLRLVDSLGNARNRRGFYGEKDPTFKLLPEQVVQIRDYLHKGVEPKKLANEFRVTVATISRIKHRRRWGHEV